MRATCIGGGPAGLTFAILARAAGHEVTVFERQQPSDSFGWGVVFPLGLLRQVDQHDPVLAEMMREHAYTWIDQVVVLEGHDPARLPSSGYSMRRQVLLELLRARARDVGVQLVAEEFDGDPLALPSELVVACDGVNSGIRTRLGGFGTQLKIRRNRYIWLGTDREFDSFTFPFVSTPAGWLWAHAYGFERGTSTFIVETTPETWTGLGLDQLDGEASALRLEMIFAGPLDGAQLRPQESLRHRPPWHQFSQVTNRRWHQGRVALMGDAAHTTHFTIGSGTRLAMEDALALAEALSVHDSIPAALVTYESARRSAIRDAQRSAARSADWYERVPRYIDRTPAEFARLMDDRRSPVMGRMPVELYLQLTRVAGRMPAVEGSVRRLVSRF